MPGVHLGSASGIDPGGQGVIPRRFKRKKIFVTDTARTPDEGWMHRRDSRNSYVDVDIDIVKQRQVISI